MGKYVLLSLVLGGAILNHVSSLLHTLVIIHPHKYSSHALEYRSQKLIYKLRT